MSLAVNKIKDLMKSPDAWRYLFSVAFFFVMIYSGIKFMNAGNSYEQAVSFRLFCIAFGLLVLTLMEVRQWLSIWSFLYLPACYVYTHYAYELHWIEDTCEYQFVDVIRLGKLVILIWGIVLIAILRDIIKNNSWKNVLSFQSVLGMLWFVFIILLTLFKRDYFYATFFVLGYTTFYFVSNKPAIKKIVWRALTDAILLSFVFVSIRMIMHRPYDCERYLAYFSNSNMAGMYLAVVIVTIYQRIDFWWKKAAGRRVKVPVLLLWYVAMGFACSVAIFNYTRTTILGLLFAFFTLFVLQMLKEKKSAVIARFTLVLVAIACLFYGTYCLIRYVPAYVDEPTFFMWEYNPETRVVQGDPVDSPKYTTMESFLTLALGKWGIYVDFSEEAAEEGTDVVIDTERDVTNGRTEIWKTYLARTNLTGHFPGHIEMESGYFCYHAHSTYFHILYQYGLFAGIVYTLMVISAYVYAILCYWRRKGEENYFLFPLLMTGLCLVGQVTEWMGHPAYVICMVFLMAYGMLLREKRSQVDER